MSKPFNTNQYDKFITAIADHDVAGLRALILLGEFILISIHDEEDENDDDDDSVGALTADLDGEEVLVVFTADEHAASFVNGMTDMFEESEEVQGFMVDGESLLEYLPKNFGMLVNPETEEAQIIVPSLATDLRQGKE